MINVGTLKGIKINQISEEGNLLLEIFKNTYGGVIKLFDIDGNLNIAMGSESTHGGINGGVFILYADYPNIGNQVAYQRVVFGNFKNDTYEYGIGQIKDRNGTARVQIMAEGTGKVAILDENEQTKTYFDESHGYINEKEIATQEWVEEQDHAYQLQISTLIDAVTALSIRVTELESRL